MVLASAANNEVADSIAAAVNGAYYILRSDVEFEMKQLTVGNVLMRDPLYSSWGEVEKSKNCKFPFIAVRLHCWNSAESKVEECIGW